MVNNYVYALVVSSIIHTRICSVLYCDYFVKRTMIKNADIKKEKCKRLLEEKCTTTLLCFFAFFRETDVWYFWKSSSKSLFITRANFIIYERKTWSSAPIINRQMNIDIEEISEAFWLNHLRNRNKTKVFISNYPYHQIKWTFH